MGVYCKSGEFLTLNIVLVARKAARFVLSACICDPAGHGEYNKFIYRNNYIHCSVVTDACAFLRAGIVHFRLPMFTWVMNAKNKCFFSLLWGSASFFSRCNQREALC